MNRLFLIFLAITALAGGCNNNTTPPTTKTDTKTDAKTNTPKTIAAATRSDGHWNATSATLAGNPFPDQITETISLVLTGDRYEVMVGDKPDKGTCITDLEQSPNRMTITGSDGPNSGTTFLAIFDFPADNEMRVCYDLSGKQFPTGFESTAGNGWYLVRYTRKE